MIKEITAQQDLENVTGGITTIRSSSFSSNTRPTGSTEDRFAAFRARAAARRAAFEEREAQREAERAANPDSGSTRRGFAPTATFGLP